MRFAAAPIGPRRLLWLAAALIAGIATLALVVGLGSQPAQANPGAVESLAGCATNALDRGDDSNFSDAIPLPFTANFFGQAYDNIYVNNNGNVTFDSGLSAFTPESLLNTSHVIIAPFWADVDTRGPLSSVVTYGGTMYNGRQAFCTNWVNVGYYDSHDDKLNSFQLLLVDRSDTGSGDFDMIMNYDGVNWETGDVDGGSGGLGGQSAAMGYSNGVDVSFEYPGSHVNGAFLDSSATGLSHNSRNSLIKGRYVFEVRNGAPPAGGTITGLVVGPPQIQSAEAGIAGSLVPMANAVVTACATPPCLTTNTNAEGQFTFTGVAPGSYHVIAYPPPGRGDIIPADTAFTLAQDEIKDVGTLTMRIPRAAPAGFVIDSIGSIGGAPVLDWSHATDFSIPGCGGGTGAWVLRASDGSVLDSGTLTESPPDTYSGTIQPLHPYHGPATLEIDIHCPSGPDESTDIDVYVDPSGVVKTVSGDPIAGATVTLYRSDSAAGPFEVVPDGSAVMSPSNRTNPDTTNADGLFHWDVAAGYYKVRAEKSGCHEPGNSSQAFVETDVLTIPPPVTDLDLRLDCGGASATPTPTPATDVWGDPDCNGSVAPRDGQAILNHFLGKTELSQTQPCPAVGDTLTVDGVSYVWGDVDCGGSVAPRDGQAILNHFLGKTELSQTLPCPAVGSLVTLGNGG